MTTSAFYGPRHAQVVALLAWLAKCNYDRVDGRDEERAVAWDAVFYAGSRKSRKEVWRAALDAATYAVPGSGLLAALCAAWDVLDEEHMTGVLAWLGPVAETIGKTPDELMNMPTRG